MFDVEQPQELARVCGKIGAAIIQFCRLRLASGNVEFHADQLRRYVADHLAIDTAPASADRILRELRRVGKVRYSVVNRRQSLYRLF